MKDKQQIEIKKNDIRNLLLIIFLPLFITFFIEHFGEFDVKSYGGSYETATVTNSSFKTPFGNTVKISDNVLAFKYQGNGDYVSLRGSGRYFEKIPYYIKGVVKDIVYPFTLIIVLLLVYFFKNKYSIKIS